MPVLLGSESPTATSGSTYFELRRSHRPISVVDSNRSLRLCLLRASHGQNKTGLVRPHFDLGFGPLNLSRAPCDLVNTSFKIPQICLGPFQPCQYLGFDPLNQSWPPCNAWLNSSCLAWALFWSCLSQCPLFGCWHIHPLVIVLLVFSCSPMPPRPDTRHAWITFGGLGKHFESPQRPRDKHKTQHHVKIL